MSFLAPTGHRFELYAEKEVTGRHGVGHHNPEAWPEDLVGMKATRFDHCLFHGEDLDGVYDIFVNVLGFWLTEQAMAGEERVAQFFTCSMKEHEIAFIKAEGNTGAFHHASFIWRRRTFCMPRYYLDTWTHSPWLDAGRRFFFDPSGNRNETFCGGDYFFPDHPVVTWDADKLGKAVFTTQGAFSHRHDLRKYHVRHFINGEYEVRPEKHSQFMRPSTVVLSVKYMKRVGKVDAAVALSSTLTGRGR